MVLSVRPVPSRVHTQRSAQLDIRKDSVRSERAEAATDVEVGSRMVKRRTTDVDLAFSSQL